jgi:hypothetical protein
MNLGYLCLSRLVYRLCSLLLGPASSHPTHEPGRRVRVSQHAHQQGREGHQSRADVQLIAFTPNSKAAYVSTSKCDRIPVPARQRQALWRPRLPTRTAAMRVPVNSVLITLREMPR